MKTKEADGNWRIREPGGPWLVAELARAARTTSAHIYALAGRGEITVFRIGGSVRVPDSEARRLLGMDTSEAA